MFGSEWLFAAMAAQADFSGAGTTLELECGGKSRAVARGERDLSGVSKTDEP